MHVLIKHCRCHPSTWHKGTLFTWCEPLPLKTDMTRLRKRWMLHSVDTFASSTVACSRAPISAQNTVYASASRDEQIADSSTMPPPPDVAFMNVLVRSRARAI